MVSDLSLLSITVKLDTIVGHGYRKITKKRHEISSTKMRFVQFMQGVRRCIGLELSQKGDIINLTDAGLKIPADMRGFIEGEKSMIIAAKR